MANLSQEVSLIVFVSAFLMLVAIGVITLVLVYQKKQTQYINAQNQLKIDFEKELLEAQLAMQEQTLKNISQEIHDNIGQTLSLAKLNLNTINFEKQQLVADKILNTKELVSKAITDLRILSKTLHTEAVLTAGLLRAIEMELELIDKTAVFKTELLTAGNPEAIDPQKELILFRTVQEALHNAIKHSGATHIKIILRYEAAFLTVSIIDNGTGFELVAVENAKEKGSGLRNMKNRAALIGGGLEIMAKNSGTTIQITVPTLPA